VEWQHNLNTLELQLKRGTQTKKRKFFIIYTYTIDERWAVEQEGVAGDGTTEAGQHNNSQEKLSWECTMDHGKSSQTIG
jgi:hypothetical protein